MEESEVKNVMYTYQRDTKSCVTPNIDIAVARRDGESTIKTETKYYNGKIEHGIVTLN